MTVRVRRLQGDLETIGRVFPPDGRIRIRETRGSPPDRYMVEYLITGIEQTQEGRLKKRQSHLVQVTLTLGYPRQAPQCRMLTPVFHPNIAPHAVCVGDHWAAGESLAHLLVRIGEMISWQSYNTKSPLNGEAARWAEANRGKLPVDPVDLTGYYDAHEGGASMAALPCANCGGRNGVETCAGGHPACNDCRVPCAGCGANPCLACGVRACAVCATAGCPACSPGCGNCRRTVCPKHGKPCGVCRKPFCFDCGDYCVTCSGFLCVEHHGACRHSA